MAKAEAHPGRTLADWQALPEDARFELIDGEFVEKAAPTFEHGVAQGAVVLELGGPFGRRRGGGPGGWVFATEVDVLLGDNVFRPDVAAWRRDRLPTDPRERPLKARPYWICEILSESNRSTDTVTKLRRYHQAGVPHYRILDEIERTLTVHRHTDAGYLLVLRAEAHETVRAEPFDAIEIKVAALLGEEDDAK